MSIVNYGSSSYDFTPLVRAGLRGTARYLRNRQQRIPMGVTPVSNSTLTDLRIRNLARAVGRNAPAVEHTTLAVTSSLPSGAVENQIAITTNFLANADFQSKVLGDKFRNLRLYHRHQFVGNVDIARIIIYVPKITGTTISSIGYSSIIDSAKFRVLYDTMVYPSSANQSRKNVVIASTPLNFLTNVDRTDETTATIQTGDIRMVIITTCSAASSMLSQYRLSFQNK